MLEENPKVALKCMSAAIHQVKNKLLREFRSLSTLTYFQGLMLNSSLTQVMRTKWVHNLEYVTKILVRLHNYSESMLALKNLKAAYIGNY